MYNKRIIIYKTVYTNMYKMIDLKYMTSGPPTVCIRLPQRPT